MKFSATRSWPDSDEQPAADLRFMRTSIGSPRGTSPCQARPRMRCAQWRSPPPTIVAESLVGVPDALLTALQPGSPASGAAVAASLAASVAPRERAVPSPAWLLPEQVRSFRRILAALELYGGALLADPVGTGKTYVSLAVAASLKQGTTACLVPAMLVNQWKATAARLDVPLALGSHEPRTAA
jgi:hypothetical protein